ncbi:unnamed protein product [Oncorhynchus mykiss]|uniref:Uncharacterized protein n=1 Tax=Oncorhynchus mykiss TaxID=8022 RepID=A0A060Z8E6_ONCMY|nr:unnamed protein product [Oncorhynchus mykiss]
MANPFPKIGDSVTKEKDHPKDCYVSEGNRVNPPSYTCPSSIGRIVKVCHLILCFPSLCVSFLCLMCLILMFLIMSLGEEEIKKEMVEYTTFVLSYIVGKMYHLLEKASANMRNNKGKILREIEVAIKHRQENK